MKPIITAIIQARVRSSRLHGKVLLPIADRTMLEHVFDRAKQAKHLNKVIIATSSESSDDPIAQICQRRKIDCFRGSLDNVLDRYYQTAKAFNLQHICRLTADCPLIDPKIIDRVAQRYLKGGIDYVSTGYPVSTFPDGLDIEIFSFEALERAQQEATLLSEKEHVTPYIWKNPAKFKIKNIRNNQDLSQMRWSVDEETDLRFVREIYKRLYKKDRLFYTEDVLLLLKKHPELQEINKGIVRNEGYLKSLKQDKVVMKKWSRIVPFKSKNKQEEIWIYKDSKAEKRYNVEVTLGKPIDILSLKLKMIEDFGSSVARTRDSRISLFKKDNLQRVDLCPICKCETKDTREILNVYGARYARCKNCSHYFVKERPTKKALEEFYSKDNQYQSTYADKRTTEARIQQVAMPKAKWVIRQFERIYGRKPKSILDVGAGSGHFVHACRNLGITTTGVELSKIGRSFCKENFGFELVNKDFIKEWKAFTDYEIITFWGVIEHVPYPLEMLNAASMILSGKEGLVIAEVPRWDCFSTTVQSVFFNSIVRHLEPLGHINCFTDSSLAMAFKESNFDIVAAWYFGMDAYELVTQISYLLNENKVIQKMGEYLSTFQDRLDLARLSDEMVFAGKPTQNSNKKINLFKPPL